VDFRMSERPWPAMDVHDLHCALSEGETVDEIAAFLMRDPEDVRRQIAELDRELELATPSSSEGSLGGL